VSRCGYIIPPNLYPKTRPEKIDTPTKNNQVQHCCKSDGEKGKSDLNRSRETVSLESERSPKGGRTFALECWCGHGLGTNVHPCTPGEGVNDRPKRCDRSLPQ
jgi:hypothetical protein